jgi:hypothetical protein
MEKNATWGVLKSNAGAGAKRVRFCQSEFQNAVGDRDLLEVVTQLKKAPNFQGCEIPFKNMWAEEQSASHFSPNRYGSSFGLTVFPKRSGSHNRSSLESFQREQVFVSGYDGLCFSRRNQPEHHEIVGITASFGVHFLGLYQFHILPMELHVFRSHAGRNFQLGPEFVINLPENSLTRNQAVPLKAEFKDRFAETA